MDRRGSTPLMIGISLLIMTGCPEPEDEGGSGWEETGETGASSGVEEGEEDVRAPDDAGTDDEGGDTEGGDTEGSEEAGTEAGGDGDGDGVVDHPDRCWDRSWAVTEFPAVLFDNTIGRNDDLLSPCGIDASPDLQVGFVAPFSGMFVFETTGSSFDTVIAIAEQQCGREMACNDDYVGLSSRVVVELELGEEITVTVDGTNPFEEGPLELHVDVFVPPVCEASVVSPPYPTQILGDTSGGANELTGPCGGEGAPERVFEFVPQGPGLYRFSTEGSSFDTVLYALDDCIEPAIACNDDLNLDLHSELVLEFGPGDTALIVVDGASPDEQGEFVLHVEKL